MQGVKSLIAIICMSLILIFALIHLAVSISILGKFGRYGDVFRPERGLAGFNIVISIFGLIISGFGLFSILTDRRNLSEVVGYTCIVLALFSLVSLITALIINSLAITYVNTRFFHHMDLYATNQKSKNILDKIQTNYACCGANTWLDWTRESLNATQSITSTASTTNTTAATTIIGNTTVTTVVAGTTTTVASETTTAASETTTAAFETTTAAFETTTAAFETTAVASENATEVGTRKELSKNMNSNFDKGNISKRSFFDIIEKTISRQDIDLKLIDDEAEITKVDPLSMTIMADDSIVEQNSLHQAVRRKRQTNSSYGGINGLPLTFGVTLPQSCCTTDLSSTEDLTNLYCLSNNVSNSFHTDGCVKPLGKRAVGQTLGLAVINSFLFLIALASIPVMLQLNSREVPPQNGAVNRPIPHYDNQYQQYSQPQYQQYYQPQYQQYYQPQYSYGGYNAPSYNPGMSFNNYNPMYGASY